MPRQSAVTRDAVVVTSLCGIVLPLVRSKEECLGISAGTSWSDLSMFGFAGSGFFVVVVVVVGFFVVVVVVVGFFVVVVVVVGFFVVVLVVVVFVVVVVVVVGSSVVVVVVSFFVVVLGLSVVVVVISVVVFRSTSGGGEFSPSSDLGDTGSGFFLGFSGVVDFEFSFGGVFVSVRE